MMIDLKLKLSTYPKAKLVFGTYQADENQIAILLVDSDTSAPICKATVYVEGWVPSKRPHLAIVNHFVLIKDYAENEGLLSELIRNGVIKSEDYGSIPTGRVEVRIRRLTDLAWQEFERQRSV